MDNFYALYLNPMRGRMEERVCVGISNNRESLQALLDHCRCEPWQDFEPGDNGRTKTWNKSFRRYSELEWMNPPEFSGEGYGIIDIGSRELYCELAGQDFDNFISRHRIY